MQINIDINTDCDSPNDVKRLICALMEEAGARTFAIESVTIDGIENFKIGKGFFTTIRYIVPVIIIIIPIYIFKLIYKIFTRK